MTSKRAWAGLSAGVGYDSVPDVAVAKRRKGLCNITNIVGAPNTANGASKKQKGPNPSGAGWASLGGPTTAPPVKPSVVCDVGDGEKEVNACALTGERARPQLSARSSIALSHPLLPALSSRWMTS